MRAIHQFWASNFLGVETFDNEQFVIIQSENRTITIVSDKIYHMSPSSPIRHIVFAIKSGFGGSWEGEEKWSRYSP